LIPTIALAPAAAEPTLAHLACPFDRLTFHERRAAAGWKCSEPGKSAWIIKSRTNQRATRGQ